MRRIGSIALLFGAAALACRAAAAPGIVDRAQHEVTAYLNRLADLHCTETVTRQKLAPNGHVEVTERSQYDYLLMMSGNAHELRLNESRVEVPSKHHKAATLPMLVSNGMATLLLVFHPYYRDSFRFEVGAEQTVQGRPAIPVRFTPIEGRRMPAALALRGRAYPLELEGTAWLDPQTGAPVRIDATLFHSMADVGLRKMHIEVSYLPSELGPAGTPITLPSVATVDVETPRQHWRNTHRFTRYKSFSTYAEQSPEVKVHEDKKAKSDDANASDPAENKEKQ